MKILFAVSEAEPFIKTGGLADVAGSLPIELAKMGHDIRVVVPLYQHIPNEYKNKMKKIGEFYVDLEWRHCYAGIFEMENQGVIFYFIDNEQYFNRQKLYGEFDDAERFIFYSKSVVMLPKYVDFKPDIIHSNDWHTALVNVYIKDFSKGDSYYKNIKSIYTIHNLKYQGIFPSSVLDIAGLSTGHYFQEYALKYYDAVNFMKGGIIFSDRFTTVSKSYAEEIKYSYFGEGLEGVIRANDYKLSGIINGIDYDVWNPETDYNIVANYDIDSIERKKENKIDLQKKYGLPTKNVPLYGMCTRLVEMKGLDLVSYVLDEFLSQDIQFVVLGTGDKQYEEMLQYFQQKYPEKMAARIYFNPKEAHKIYAGCDFFVMPSIAEPCGISQLIAMRYGTIPIVRETGGLSDTVEAYNRYEKKGNGFSFANINAHELKDTLFRAFNVYGTEDFTEIIKNAMKTDNSWKQSAKEYEKIYKELL